MKKIERFPQRSGNSRAASASVDLVRKGNSKRPGTRPKTHNNPIRGKGKGGVSPAWGKRVEGGGTALSKQKQKGGQGLLRNLGLGRKASLSSKGFPPWKNENWTRREGASLAKKKKKPQKNPKKKKKKKKKKKRQKKRKKN